MTSGEPSDKYAQSGLFLAFEGGEGCGKYAQSGLFLAFEGGEGCGKSTQAALLATVLRERGHTVELTREPGGTPVGSRLREILLDTSTFMSSRTETLIYAADKAEHVEQLIRPALQAGHTVITDRYVDSTLAYQGAGRALQIEDIAPITAWATSGLRPHLTFVLDLDPEVGLARAKARAAHDRIEAEPLDFHRRVRQHFLELAAADTEHYVVISADRAAEAVQEQVQSGLDLWLAKA
jgi:dTMP kinase